MSDEIYNLALLELMEERKAGKIDERNFMRGLMILEEPGHNPCKDVKDVFRAGRTLGHLASVN